MLAILSLALAFTWLPWNHMYWTGADCCPRGDLVIDDVVARSFESDMM